MPQRLWMWVVVLGCIHGPVFVVGPTWPPDALDLGEALYARRCPSYCSCSIWRGLRRADCRESRLLSVELGLPREVEVADLAKNLISKLDDGCFQELELVQLTELILRDNAIQSIGLLAFAGLRRLTSIDLSNNHLQTLNPNTFINNRRLKVVLLAGNNFARLAPDRPVLAAPHLQVLDLSRCKLPHLDRSIFAELPALASLNLSGNYLNQLKPAVFERLQQLQALDADHNPLNCDFSTNEVISQLRSHNVTVVHPCPAQSAPSKHLARLLADVIPGVPKESQEQTEGRFERMQEIDGLLGMPWGLDSTKSVEDTDIEVNENVSSPKISINNPDVKNSVECSPPYKENTANPAFLKDLFDAIPSFWACIIGFQVGLFVAASLTCVCRSALWRALCKDHSRARGARRAAAALSLSASPSAPSGLPCRLDSTFTTEDEVLWTGDGSERPETPPPAYHELSWSSCSQLQHQAASWY